MSNHAHDLFCNEAVNILGDVKKKESMSGEETFPLVERIVWETCYVSLVLVPQYLVSQEIPYVGSSCQQGKGFQEAEAGC